jgi:hypothetical protein
MGAALVALVAATSSGAEASRSSTAQVTPIGSHSGKLAVLVNLSSSGHGKFTARGVVADSGVAASERRVTPKRVRLKVTLTGVGGTFRIVVAQLCGSTKSTWTIVTGTKAYRGLTGHGTGRGRIPCGRGGVRISLGGTAKRAVLPLALPGTYRGTHASLNLRVTFDVVATGGAVTNASFEQLVARCASSKILFLSPRFTANYPIGTDKRFSFSENGYQVSGAFSTHSAKGTISYDSGGCHMDPVSWSAVTPPPALPLVRTGRYCGFTVQGPGICLTATPDGWVANTVMGGNIRCFSPDSAVFKISYQYDGLIVIRSDLTFHAELTKIPLDGGGSMAFRITGKFDTNGGATGSGGFTSVSLFRNGKLYSCRGAVSTWSAQLGR